MIYFKNANVLINEKFEKVNFAVENGEFVEISTKNYDENAVDLGGKFVIPGLIDIHTHGAVGVDFNNITEESVKKACNFYNSQGVTSVLPTILTDTKETTLKCIETIVKAKENLQIDTILGIHLEGPFLSTDYKGAMPEHLLLKPNVDLFLEYVKKSNGLVKLTTVSPELPGACDFAKEITKRGIVVSLGHSGATQEQAFAFFDSGATNVTHLGNAMKQPTQHNLNVCGSALHKNVYTEIICDGFHINPTVIDYWFSVKSKDKMIAITDSIMASGLPDGDYMLGVNEVTVTNGDAKLKGKDVRAGSTLKAVNAVKNIAKYTNQPFEQAVKYMTINPATSLGVQDKKGSINQGKDADFVVLDADYNILSTYSKGKLVYNK